MNESIKTLGYLSWKDPYAWMESMKGSRWQAAMKHQEAHRKPYIEQIAQTKTELSVELDIHDIEEEQQLFEIRYSQTGASSFQWHFEDSTEQRRCGDLDARKGKQVWVVEDTETGDESYRIVHWSNGKQAWASKRGHGPFVAVLGSFVYALEAENFLWYCRLVRYKAASGTGHEIVFELNEPEWNLTLLKGEHECLFLVANNAGQQRLWLIQTSGLKELTGMYESFVPVGYPKKGSSDVCFFGRLKGNSDYQPVGTALSALRFPSLGLYTPEADTFTQHRFVGRRYGKRFVWNTQRPLMEKIVVGEVPLDTHQAYHGSEKSLFLMLPGQSTYLYGEHASECAYAQTRTWFASSRDGTKVPVVLVSSCKPHSILVIGYAAYGLPTHMGTDRWRPLLRRGWGLVYVLARGSGDHTDAWAEAARREMKYKSVEDFEAGIRSAQTRLHIGASGTFLYGRSAGGYLVGATLARNASGHLFRGLYTEVPYVDVLSTTANPSLPLTQLEYNEFGNPLAKPQDAQALLTLSPIHALPTSRAPTIFVLCRTALHDKEVFAYESFKWITTLQENEGAPKLLTLSERAGHFGREGRAEDLALFLFLAQRGKKPNDRVYKMANTRRNTRRNRKNRKASRKNRKNNMTARRNNAAMMGGKRKRRNMTRRRR